MRSSSTAAARSSSASPRASSSLASPRSSSSRYSTFRGGDYSTGNRAAFGLASPMEDSEFSESDANVSEKPSRASVSTARGGGAKWDADDEPAASPFGSSGDE